MVAKSRGGERRGGGIADSVEDILEIRSNCVDLRNHRFIAIVEDMVGTARFDEGCVARAAGGNYLEAADRRELDGIQSNASCFRSVSVAFNHDGQSRIHIQLPPHTSTLVPEALERSRLRQSLENRASHAVAAARGTVLACSREMLAGTLKETF